MTPGRIQKKIPPSLDPLHNLHNIPSCPLISTLEVPFSHLLLSSIAITLFEATIIAHLHYHKNLWAGDTATADRTIHCSAFESTNPSNGHYFLLSLDSAQSAKCSFLTLCLEIISDSQKIWKNSTKTFHTPLTQTSILLLSLYGESYMKVKVSVTQACPTLCDPMDCSLPGFSIHGIFQARVLEWDTFKS